MVTVKNFDLLLFYEPQQRAISGSCVFSFPEPITSLSYRRIVDFSRSVTQQPFLSKLLLQKKVFIQLFI